MKRIFTLIAVLSGSMGLMVASVQAATIVNSGDSSVVLVVTENGAPGDVSVDAAETVEFCLSGCFVTFPNGDRQALTGNETIEINADKVLVR